MSTKLNQRYSNREKAKRTVSKPVSYKASDVVVIRESKKAKNPGRNKGKEISINTQENVIGLSKFITKPLKLPNRKEKLACIRERVIVLKYGYIWLRKIFGKISPSKARKFYEKRLLNNSFQKWEDFWWKGKNEWKLNIRADYHNRFRLWLKIWKAWRSYVTLARIKTTKMKLAEKKANSVILHKCITSWKLYVGKRGEKREFYDQAMNGGEFLIKRFALNKWKKSLNFKRNVQVKENEALYFWSRTLLSKAWVCWLNSYNTAVENERKVLCVVHFHNTKLAIRVLRCFKIYTMQRKLKKLRVESGIRFHKHRNLRYCYGIWKSNWLRKRQLEQFEEAIIQKGISAKKRRLFVAWRFYINICHKKEEKTWMAQSHFERLLKVKFVKKLREQVTHRKKKYLQNMIAFDYYKKSLVKQTWDHWLGRCENREELRLLNVNRSVRRHYHVVLSKKILRYWQLFCKQRKTRKNIKMKADDMARKVLLPKYFGKWQIYVEMTHVSQENRQKADEFRRECLLAKTYYNWYRCYQEMLDVHMLYRMAVLSYDDKIRQRFFRTWFTRTKQKLRENELMVKCQAHNEKRLKIKYFHGWHQVIVDMNHGIVKLRKAVIHYNTKLTTTCWRYWTKFTDLRRAKSQKKAKAYYCFQYKILNQTLIAWKTYVHSARETNRLAEDRKLHHDKTNLRISFHRWRENVRVLRESKENASISSKHWQMKMKTKCFHSWKIYSAHRLCKRHQTFLEVRQTENYLRHGRTFRYFQKWKQAMFTKIRENNLSTKASDHWRKQCLRKYIGKWRTFRFIGYTKHVLQQQCMWYHNQRILVVSLGKWKTNFHERREFKKKTQLSLWLWSFSLQRKVFGAWLHYSQDKKRRKAAVYEALERRRKWLYQVAITQWIKFATDSIAERETLATTRHVRLSENIQRCVRKCALHWKRVTEESRKTRPQLSKNTALNTSTLFPKQTSTTNRIFSKTGDIEIPPINKPRRKPRGAEYLRDSFNMSQMVDENCTMATSDSDEALPRQWPCNLQPTSAPLRSHDRNLLDKDNDINSVTKDVSIIHSEMTAACDTVTYTHDKAPFAYKDINLRRSDPPTQVSIDPRSRTNSAHGFGSTAARGNSCISRGRSILLPPSSFTTTKHQVGDVKKTECTETESRRKDEMDITSFLSDKKKQQSVIQLRDRMRRYFTVSKEIKDLQEKIQSLQEWIKEPTVKELSNDEASLAKELIKKYSEEVTVLNEGLETRYLTIVNELQNVVNNI